MTAKIDAFIAQIRSRPAFANAAATDAQYSEHLSNIERGLNAIARQADDDPATIEIFDKIVDLIGRSDISMKQRLLDLGKLITVVRDAGRTVN